MKTDPLRASDPRLTGRIGGLVVPHAPVLLPSVGGDEAAAQTKPIRDALDEVRFDGADVIALLSPHGAETGVYEKVTGSLNDFGVHGVDATRDTDEGAARAVANAWGRPMLQGPVDHGITVPLLLLTTGSIPVVAASLKETHCFDRTAVEEAIDAGRELTRALGALDGRRVAFVSSSNTSSALSPGAPMTERKPAQELETELLKSLPLNVSALDDLVTPMGIEGSCAAGTLAAFAALFGGLRPEILAYEAPFGVGYLVATVRLED